MKIKQTYNIALALGLAASLTSTFAHAQITALPSQQQEHILVSAENGNPVSETLSGINLTPTKHGTYQLDFTQHLDESAMLEITDTSGRIVYKKSVPVDGIKNAWRYQLGKLKPDTYLIEVKTSDTTYWTKFKVGK